MTTLPALISPPNPLDRIKALVLDSVSSQHSRRAYSTALDDFVSWCTDHEPPGFSRATVQAYRADLEAQNYAPSTINVRLAAIRKLAMEAAENGLLDREAAAAIARVKGAKSHGVRSGNWLTAAQAEQLLCWPDRETNRGRRDRALLCLLIGCGLRRDELAHLQLTHIALRDARWVIADLVGKGHRVRTVPMPSWCKVAIDEWTAGAAIGTGPVLRRVDKADKVLRGGLSGQSVRLIVEAYGYRIGVAIAPHDLRRSFAKLSNTGRARLEQIQLALGHASIQTTERYLGTHLDLQDAACDHLNLRISE